MIRSLKRPELNLLAAKVGLSVRGKTQDGTTTLAFLAGQAPLAAVVRLHESPPATSRQQSVRSR